jgi:hypothetical protein
MWKRRPSSQQHANSPVRQAAADLEATALGVSMVKHGSRYRVYIDDVAIGQLWRNPLGAWGYTTTDGHDGLIHLRARSARDALVKRHLRRSGGIGEAT